MTLMQDQIEFLPSTKECLASVEFNWKSRAIVGVFQGEVTVDDVLSFWDALMKEDLPPETKGVLLDFSNAKLSFKASGYLRIVDYFVENISFVGRFKIGVVANTPHNIVVLMLIARENFMYELRPFTTRRACLVWIKG
ncbi:hypothetical protein [Marinilabilia salmonicolor]|uniref:hypothetical protein n=1 Tax=Marinilabilia salmonicolor TaxID=989 RepID=UPI00029AACB4|nr:hypothetical protein [Marinilabilia salmonicolor]